MCGGKRRGKDTLLQLRSIWIITFSIYLGLFLRIDVASAQKADDIAISDSTDVLRVEIVRAESLFKARRIADLLYMKMTRPVFIGTQDEEYVVHVGGCADRTEAMLVVDSLHTMGIRNARIVQGSRFDRMVRTGGYRAETGRQRIQALMAEGPVQIDGLLNEPDWERAVPVTRFTQQRPYDGKTASERTEVRVLRDEDYLYFGFICYDSHPDKIIATEMRRDASIRYDDAIGIFLDTFYDKKNCYYFSTNSVSARYDAMVTDEGQQVNEDWNTLWFCRSQKQRYGWTTEIAIPFYAIRYKKNQEVWGVNFARNVERLNEDNYWMYIPRGLSRRGKYMASLYGDLVGLGGNIREKSFEVIPYVRGGLIKKDLYSSNTSEGDGGFDLRYRFSGNAYADVTYNTDFAQVEADQEVVNTTRFSTLFPEKRDFFLDNAGFLQFGDNSFISSNRLRVTFERDPIGSLYQIYYSRRIGLVEGQQVPILGGMKMRGKFGKYEMGLMSLQTKETELGDDRIEPATNYSVVRVKRDLLRNSNIGLIAMNKESDDHYNRSIGINGFFPVHQNFSMGASLAKTLTPGMEGKDYAAGAFTHLQTDKLTWALKYLTLEENFNPETGFVMQPRIRTYYSRITLQQYIHRMWLQNIRLASSYFYITNLEDDLISRRVSLSNFTYFTNGDRLYLLYFRHFDAIEEDDNIRHLSIPIGAYKYRTYQATYEMDSSRPVALGFGYRYTDAFHGRQRTGDVELDLKLKSHFTMQAKYKYKHVELPTGWFYANILSTRFIYMFNPDVYIKAYVQWNDFDDRLSTNLLFHYIFNGNSNFYIVYNETRDPDAPRMITRDRVALLKFEYHLFK